MKTENIEYIAYKSGIVPYIQKILQPVVYSEDVKLDEVNKIAICGRGPSLKFINELEDLDIYVIMNDFNGALSDPTIYRTLSDKRIVHMTNRGEHKLNFHHLLKLNIVRYQYRMLQSNNGEQFWYDSRKEYSAELKGLNPKYLPNGIEPILNNNFKEPELRNIGLIAILFVAYYYKPDSIHCVGIDFFDDIEWFDNKSPNVDTQNVRKKSPRMKENMAKIVDMFPDITFHMITTGNINYSKENLDVDQR